MNESVKPEEEADDEIISPGRLEDTSPLPTSLSFGSARFPSQPILDRSATPQQQMSFSYPPLARDYQPYTAYRPPIFPSSSYGRPSVSPLNTNTFSQQSHFYSFDSTTHTSPPLSSSSSSGLSVGGTMYSSTPSFNFQSRPQGSMPPPPTTSTKRKSFDADDGSGFGALGIETEDLESVEGEDYFGSASAGGDGEDGEEGGERKKGRSASSGSATGQSPSTSKTLDPVARQARIQAEQRRRNDLQESFRKLKEVLPPGNDKASKKLILERAVTRINDLNHQNRTLMERLERYEGPTSSSSSTGASSSSSRTHQPLPPRPHISVPHPPPPDAFPPPSPSGPRSASHAPPLFPPPPTPRSTFIDPSAPSMPQFAFDSHRNQPQTPRDL